MKKYLVLFSIGLLILFVSGTFEFIYASTLYFNSFTSSYSGFTEYFGTCSPTSVGLSCNDTDAFYNISFPSMKCISADIDIHNIRDGIFFADGSFTSWVGLSASGLLQTNDGFLHAYDTLSGNDTSLGVNTPAQGTFHNYSICKNSDTYTFYLDSNLIGTKTYSNHSGGYMAFEAKSDTIIKNLTATDSLPNLVTPTPTVPTPTPFPDNHLNVPLIKQTANPWQSLEYDSAHIWAPLNKTIHDWGCAITDVAMVFQFHGITRMPDNSPVNPDTINKWLKTQPDGYVGDGLVNWLAISRLSLLAKNSGNNPNFSSADALEFDRSEGTSDLDTELLVDDVKALPDILEEPGHFVVATGTKSNPNTFYINDSYFPRLTLNDGYNNTYLSVNRFHPTHTDLSYVLLVGPQNINFSAKNSSGNSAGYEFIQQPLEDPANPGQFSGPPVKMFYLKQPNTDSYAITITGNTTYSAKAYMYDQSGKVQVTTLTGSGTLSNPDTFLVNFSKTNSKDDKINKSSAFDIIITDINTLYHQEQIKKDIYKQLLQKINEAKNQYTKKHFLQEKISLAELLLKIIVLNGNHKISDSAYQTLVEDIMHLLTQ